MQGTGQQLQTLAAKNHEEPRTVHPGSIFTAAPSVHRDKSVEIEGPSIALHVVIALHLITVQPINLLLMAARLPIHQAQQTRRQSFTQVTAIFRKCRRLQAGILADTSTCDGKNLPILTPSHAVLGQLQETCPRGAQFLLGQAFLQYLPFGTSGT